jgi:putative ABC transport system permease protein
MSTLSRKARGDLTRHRARTLLAVCTLSIAIASLGFLAVPILLNAAMNRQIAGSHLYDVGISTSTLDLSPAQLRALGRLPGVAAVSPAVGYATTVTSAAGPQDVELAGTALASAPVNTVTLFTGRIPGPGEVLADAGNTRAAGFTVPVGGTISVRAASGALVRLRVSGTGLNLAATPGANGSSTPVFYAPTATVQALHGVRGYNYLGFRLADDNTAAQWRVVAEARAYLTAQTGTDPITALPAVRSPGQWPGQSGFGHIVALLYIITILAFLSALFLISATMNTLIAEQAGEIAILKTLGGRRRRIAGITVRTAAILGAAGAVLGTIAGIAIADLLAGYFAVKLIDVSFGFAISVPVVVASLVAGPALAVAASLPALRRALRRPVAETLAGTGTGGYGSGWLDRLAARSGLLAGTRLPGSMRMGVRNALRQKRRSAATIAQVALAAGLAIAFLALGQSVTAVISQTIGTLHFSIGAGEAASRGARPFGSQALAVAATTPGVAGAQPIETSSVQYNGQTYVAWGLGAHPLYSYRLTAGHWFTTADTTADTAADTAATVPPVVLGPALARAARASVGQILTLSVAAGPTRVRVIGIDAVPTNNGDTVYFPLPVLERLDGGPGTADSIWLTTASSAHAAIDHAATAAASRLAAAGYPVSTTEIYVTQAQITAADTAILTVVQILGLVVVAIMLMGLVSALSMGAIERTREVGILRCVGARARHIRRIFSAEAMVLAAAGWAFGVLLGWLIYQGLLALLLHDAALSLPQEFPPVIPLTALAGILALTLIVIRGPLRRATRIQPGTALRYQ